MRGKVPICLSTTTSICSTRPLRRPKSVNCTKFGQNKNSGPICSVKIQEYFHSITSTSCWSNFSFEARRDLALVARTSTPHPLRSWPAHLNLIYRLRSQLTHPLASHTVIIQSVNTSTTYMRAKTSSWRRASMPNAGVRWRTSILQSKKQTHIYSV